MLARRIITTILCRGRTMVKGERYQSWRSVGVAAQAVRVHQSRQVDEILLLDVAATTEGRGPNFQLVDELASDCWGPLSVGGGIRNLNDIKTLLRMGADKVVIGTKALELVEPAADKFGRQAIIVSADIKAGTIHQRSGTVDTGLEPVAYCQMMDRLRAGEIIISSVDRDGTMEGYDIDLIKRVAAAVSVPVIASGGCRDYADMLAAIQVGADAVAAGAVFQFTENTPAGAAQYLRAHGITVRT